MDVSGEHEIFASKRKDCLLLIAVAIKYQHFFFFFVPVLQAPISIEQHTEGHTIAASEVTYVTGGEPKLCKPKSLYWAISMLH